MTLDEFRAVDREARRAKPKLFSLAPPDTPASEQALDNLERAIGVALPISYRAFLKEFGGGDFGLTTVFSADPNSEWYLEKKYNHFRKGLAEHVLPFSDDFAGGLYVLKIVHGLALEPVYYWNTDGGLVSTEFSNMFEFVARYAFEPA